MKRILGVKFRNCGQIIPFYCTDPNIQPGTAVLAETGQGIGLGQVVTARDTLLDEAMQKDVRDITRTLTPADDARI
jgi:cell fate regulator YaaT (PSP1 superfamily)